MSKVNRRNKLAELRALRQAGKKAFENYKVEDVENLYEEVDEDGYKKIVRDRLNQDDFVVDDNGEGYADDGREEWDRLHVYQSDSEDDAPVVGRPSKTSKLQILCTDHWLDAEALQARNSARRIRPNVTPMTGTSPSTSTRELPCPRQNQRWAFSMEITNP